VVVNDARGIGKKAGRFLADGRMRSVNGERAREDDHPIVLFIDFERSMRKRLLR